MLKVTTRLFATGVLAATIAALNTGAFAAETKTEDCGGCCQKPAAASAQKTTAKATLGQEGRGKAAHQHAKSAKLASAGGDSCCKKPAAVKTATKTVAKKSIKS